MLCLVAPAAAAQDDPHWNKNTCDACHDSNKPVVGAAGLQGGHAEALCETCHGDRGKALSCRHTSGMAEGSVTVTGRLRPAMTEGQVVCGTCHDITYQCTHPTRQYSLHNPGFLRNRTSRETGDYCFQCHEQSGYEKLNPHKGAASSPGPTCLLCHETNPDVIVTGRPEVNFNMQHDLNDACRGCHVVRPHPKSMSFAASQAPEEWVHLVAPSAEVLGNMRDSQSETGVGLPLNPLNGEVFCATCHDPHEAGEPALKHRLRVDDICQACHDK